MLLTLITGRANAGKTGEIHSRVVASLEAGESPVLLLPTRPDVRRATAELSSRAPVGLRITTLDAWAQELWRLHGDGRRIVGRAGREALVERAVMACADAVGPSTKAPGFARLIASLVASGGAADDTGPAVAVCGTPGVRKIVARYRDLVGELGLVEFVQTLALLSAKEIPGLGAVGVNRFADLSEAHAGFLLGLANHTEVALALTWEEGFAATLALDGLVSRLVGAGAVHLHLDVGEGTRELDLFEARLYVGGPVPHGADGEVVFGEATGGMGECALVAEVVAGEIAGGVEPGRIVVAFPDVAGRHVAIEAALQTEGVPYEMDFVQPLAETPFGRSVCSLIDLATGAGGREEAMAFLLGPYSDADPHETARLDVEWRRRCVTAGPGLCKSIEEMGGRTAASVAAARSAAQQQVAPPSVEKWQKLAFALFASARDGAREGADATIDAAAVRQFVGVVEEMASMEGNPFGARDLRRALGAVYVSIVSTESPGHVQVTEARRIRSRRFDTVVLGGLTALESPVDTRDSIAEELRRAYGGSSVQRGALERLLFYATTTRARRRLVLVRQMADDAGTPLRASVLWDEAMDLYRAEDAAGKETLPPGLDVRRKSAADIAAYIPAYTQGRREIREAARRIGYAGPSRGELTAPESLASMAGRGPFSVTEIEAYLQCPYRWFYQRVVRPREIDTSIDVREIGTRTHDILAEFYRRLHGETGEPRVTLESLERVRWLLDEVGEAVASSRPAPSDLAEEFAVKAALSRAWGIVEDDAHVLPGFVPVVQEWGFGQESREPFTFGGVELAGTVDRIDASDNALVVMDYKSSPTVHGHDDFEKRGLVQAVVYAVAATRTFDKPIAASVYRSLRSHAMRGLWVPQRLTRGLDHGHKADALEQGDVERLIQGAEERVAQAAAGIGGGRIPRKPKTANACGFCPIAAGCEGAGR
ncbi:MAG: PD-(D/E)XK nuclease family protein [Actinomycetota bacterium]|nr:PD-(D/E)XK nuclease family protein [Actinomycetota bacterium]